MSSQQTSDPEVRTHTNRQLPKVRQRASVRYACPPGTPGRVFGAADAEILRAWVVNLSTGGIGLLLDRSLAQDSQLLIQMEPGGKALQPPREARVAHSLKQGEGEWLVGCEFAHPLSPPELTEWLAGTDP
jgi:hypothetical protein